VEGVLLREKELFMAKGDTIKPRRTNSVSMSADCTEFSQLIFVCENLRNLWMNSLPELINIFLFFADSRALLRIIFTGRRDQQNRMDRHKESCETSDRGPQAGCSAEAQPSVLDIFVQEFQRLTRFALGMGLDPTRAEDVLQDVSLQVLKHQRLELNNGQARAWLFRTTANRCRLEHRRRLVAVKQGQVRAERLSKQDLPCTDPGRIAIKAEQVEAVSQALDELDHDLAAPLVLRYFCDLSSEQIGDILKLSASAVRTRLQQARLCLARQLIEKGLEP
jgi:RNA polymerase sigma factor (sigma-70 family)